jgi:hypothetical protein
VLCTSAAQADSFAVFFNGGNGYTGLFSGANTVYHAAEFPTSTPKANCTGSCNGVSGDIIQTSITFNTTDQITATTNATNVWLDQTPNFAGIGLQTASGSPGTGDDQIEGAGVLHFHFATAVILTGVATLFDPGHAPFGSGFSTNQSILGAEHFSFCAANGSCSPSTLETFTFANTFGDAFNTTPDTDFFFKSSDNVNFYVSALSFQPDPAGAPGPVVGAGFPGMLTILVGSLMWWRRKLTFSMMP